MDNIRGVVYYPHFYKDGIQKEVIAVCKVNFDWLILRELIVFNRLFIKKEDEIRLANEAGALFAGYDDVLKKVELS